MTLFCLLFFLCSRWRECLVCYKIACIIFNVDGIFLHSFLLMIKQTISHSISVSHYQLKWNKNGIQDGMALRRAVNTLFSKLSLTYGWSFFFFLRWSVWYKIICSTKPTEIVICQVCCTDIFMLSLFVIVSYSDAIVIVNYNEVHSSSTQKACLVIQIRAFLSKDLQ